MIRLPSFGGLLGAALLATLALARPAVAQAVPKDQVGQAGQQGQAAGDAAVAHVQAAQEASAAGDHKKAIKEYEAGYKVAKNPTLLIAIALEWRELGNAHRARVALRQFLKEAPADHKKRGEAQALLNKFEAEKAAKGGATTAAADDAAVADEAAAADASGATGEGEGQGDAQPAAAAPTPSLEFQPEAIPLQLDDGEKPIEKRLRAHAASPQGTVLGLPTTEKKAEPVAPTPIYKQWWFWALAAAVVGGGVALGVVATRPTTTAPHECPGDVFGCYGYDRNR